MRKIHFDVYKMGKRGDIFMIVNPNNIDILGIRKDGGVDLKIISSGELDDSESTQKLLLDKIENYLGYISSDEFRQECPDASAQNTYIILQLSEKPPALISELVTKIIPWVAEYGATFTVQIES